MQLGSLEIYSAGKDLSITGNYIQHSTHTMLNKYPGYKALRDVR